MGKIKLICDSMADLTKDQIEKYDIEVLPLTVILDDKEYKDGIDFELDEFYQLLKDKKYPKTSQVTYGQFKTAFDKYVADGRTIFYIASSANATGSYQSAVMAKNDTEGDIHIFDTLTLSLGSAQFVVKACELIENNKDGLIYDYQNIHELSRCIERIYNDRELLRYLSKNGKKSAIKFSSTRNAKEIYEVYLEILNEENK